MSDGRRDFFREHPGQGCQVSTVTVTELRNRRRKLGKSVPVHPSLKNKVLLSAIIIARSAIASQTQPITIEFSGFDLEPERPCGDRVRLPHARNATCSGVTSSSTAPCLMTITLRNSVAWRCDVEPDVRQRSALFVRTVAAFRFIPASFARFIGDFRNAALNAS